MFMMPGSKALPITTLFIIVYVITGSNGQSAESDAGPSVYKTFCQRSSTRTALSMCYKSAPDKSVNIFGTDFYSAATKGTVETPSQSPSKGFFTIVGKSDTVFEVICDFKTDMQKNPLIKLNTGSTELTTTMKITSGTSPLDPTAMRLTGVLKKTANIIFAANAPVAMKCSWRKTQWSPYSPVVKLSPNTNQDNIAEVLSAHIYG